jgi:hypothetical protein
MNDINKELTIDKAHIDDDAINNPIFIQKYLDIYYDRLKELNEIQAQYDESYSLKLQYYRNQYKYIPETVKELEAMVQGDKEIIDIKRKMNDINLQISYAKDCVQQFKDRQWAIKNAIEFIKFINGNSM